MNQERNEKLEMMINPKGAQGGNVRFNHLNDEQQREIAQHWKAHGITATQQRYGISNKRIRLILTRLGIEDTKATGRDGAHQRRQADKLTNALQRLEAMRGKEYLIAASVRTLTGYEVRGEWVYVQTRFESGTEKALKVKACELNKELAALIPYNGCR